MKTYSPSCQNPFKCVAILSCLWLAFLNPTFTGSVLRSGSVPSSVNVPNGIQQHALHLTPSQKCLGYQLKTISDTTSGLKGKLTLIGDGCHAFDEDIADLTVEVVYETENRLHVHIYDTAKAQFQIPIEVFPLPTDFNSSAKDHTGLAFEHSTDGPFEFWIRRTDGSGEIIFDTRKFPIIFEKQYLQISSHLPENANIYGLGEYISSSGFRRDPYNTTQTFWTRDAPNPVNENEYGVHPVYYEHRLGKPNHSSGSKSHAVFIKNSHGMDILLRKGMIEYRAIGGTLDFYFFAGPTPTASIEQYVQLVGLPQLSPYWAFGFHLLRWGYKTLEQTRENVRKMRQANIPLEVQWNDIDYMLDYRNFELASDKSNRFPVKEMKEFISELHTNHQYYIPIIDAGIHKVDPKNQTDIYDVYSRGAALNTFLHNPDGSEYIGKVWPGYTVFPDWFANNTQKWWTQAFRNFSETQVDFDGIWLDMNEPSSFCEGSCGSHAFLSDVNPGSVLPGQIGNSVEDHPEGHNPSFSGRPGDPATFPSRAKARLEGQRPSLHMQKRDIITSMNESMPESKPSEASDQDLNLPGYAIHNGEGALNVKTVSVNATHANGLKVYHTHNLWGHMEAIATHNALLEVHPNRRPFIVSRSTFASGGRKTAHWLGDNYSTWKSMRYSIQGVLQFQAFGIPMVGPDTCGFEGNSNEELCNRWMMLSAFYPFYRNHNTLEAISQEPYVWPSVAQASRTAINIRYKLLPYFYSEMAKASLTGTPPIKALFWEFPDDPSLVSNDKQFMFGHSILVSPVLEPNTSTLKAQLPGGDKVIWRDWYTLDPITVGAGSEVTLSAPLSHINLHIRGGSILLMHLVPAYTTYETQKGPFELLVTLDRQETATAKIYVDDGHSYTPESAWLDFEAGNRSLTGRKRKEFKINQRLERITLVGVKRSEEGDKSQRFFKLNGRPINPSESKNGTILVFDELELDLNTYWNLTWNYSF